MPDEGLDKILKNLKGQDEKLTAFVKWIKKLNAVVDDQGDRLRSMKRRVDQNTEHINRWLDDEFEYMTDEEIRDMGDVEFDIAPSALYEGESVDFVKGVFYHEDIDVIQAAIDDYMSQEMYLYCQALEDIKQGRRL